MRRAAKVDRNHPAIVRALQSVGATVKSLASVGQGTPDLLVGYRRETFLLEVKDGEAVISRQRLTEDQEEWHRVWRGLPVAIVRDVNEALLAIGATRGTA